VIKELKLKILIEDEFLHLCNEIQNRNLSLNEWRKIASTDMFQSPNYCGGFDEIEDAFCFSYYDKDGKEFWFQIDLEDVNKIVAESKTSLEIRPAN
jgi:hypothetical protein